MAERYETYAASTRTPERDALIVALFDSGVSCSRIAEKLAVSYGTAWWVLARAGRLGETRTERTRDNRRSAAKALREQGMGVTEIANTLGVAGSTVRLDIKHLDKK